MTLPKYEHKTISIGASFPDYTVITQCIPDCPACALRKVVEWLVERKYQFSDGEGLYLMPKDWAELRREALEAKP